MTSPAFVMLAVAWCAEGLELVGSSGWSVAVWRLRRLPDGLGDLTGLGRRRGRVKNAQSAAYAYPVTNRGRTDGEFLCCVDHWFHRYVPLFVSPTRCRTGFRSVIESLLKGWDSQHLHGDTT